MSSVAKLDDNGHGFKSLSSPVLARPVTQREGKVTAKLTRDTAASFGGKHHSQTLAHEIQASFGGRHHSQTLAHEIPVSFSGKTSLTNAFAKQTALEESLDAS